MHWKMMPKTQVMHHAKVSPAMTYSAVVKLRTGKDAVVHQ